MNEPMAECDHADTFKILKDRSSFFSSLFLRQTWTAVFTSPKQKVDQIYTKSEEGEKCSSQPAMETQTDKLSSLVVASNIS